MCLYRRWQQTVTNRSCIRASLADGGWTLVHRFKAWCRLAPPPLDQHRVQRSGRYTAVEQHFPNPLHSSASVHWRPCIPPRRRPRPPHATLLIARIAQSSLPIRGRRTRKAHAKPHRNGIRVRLLRRESLPGRPMRHLTMAPLIVEAPPVFFGSPQFESDSDGEVEVGGDECASAA